MVGRWNRCDRKIPPQDDEVLVLVDGMYHIGYWYEQLDGGRWWVHGLAMFDMNPTYWMPLPKRPRGMK